MNGRYPRAEPVWHQTRDAWFWIFARFSPPFVALNLIWEIFQLPLYGIWTQRDWPYQVFAVLHCTVGDLMIGLCALLLALALTGAGPPASWRYGRLLSVTIVLSLGYTVFSEWMNTVLRESWNYSAWMPVVPILGTGVSPLLQWIIVPAAAFHIGRMTSATKNAREGCAS